MRPCCGTMIYTPDNVRVQNGFAIFTASATEQLAIRLAAIESIKAKYCELDRCWELTLRTASGLKHRFTFSTMGNVLDALIGAHTG